MNIFKKLANALKNTRDNFKRKIDSLLSGGQLNDDFYEELTDILISCDIGYESAEEIVEELRDYAHDKKLRNADDVRNALKVILKQTLSEVESCKIDYPAILTIVGVNGVGKTTSIGKLAAYFKREKKSVTLVAGDTFRAAASNQLTQWADRNKVRIIKHEEGADAAAVVFDGVSSAKAKSTDVLLIDTAGRLHNKTNLMEELAKIDRILTRESQDFNRLNLIVLDATTGQNALSQIDSFNQFISIDGIILTKLDGTAKGGVIISIAKKYNLPVLFVGVGEGIDDLEVFDYDTYVDSLF